MKTTAATLKLLPPAPQKCPMCATAHAPTDPHNANSLYYALRFKLAHGRDATWSDAIAHCDDVTQALWAHVLRKRHAWTETPNPIAEPVLSSQYTPLRDGTHAPNPRQTPLTN